MTLITILSDPVVTPPPWCPAVMASCPGSRWSASPSTPWLKMEPTGEKTARFIKLEQGGTVR